MMLESGPARAGGGRRRDAVVAGAGLAGYLVAAFAPPWVVVLVLVLVALVLLLSLSGVLSQGSGSARLVAFTADGIVWLLELGPRHHPGAIVGHEPLSAWRPLPVAGLWLRQNLADEHVSVPGLGWRDQMPRR
jgi:hypothetical protein